MGREPLRLRRPSDDSVVCRRLVVGESFAARFLGLMGRRSLDPDEGLYLPTSSIHMLFMRFPIDALFVGPPDAGGSRRVLATVHQLPPWRGIVLPVRGAQGVVELATGTLARHAIEVDDVILFEPPPEPAPPSTQG